jgi:two-component system LytT family response regulator
MKTINISLIEDEPQSLSLLKDTIQALGNQYSLVSATSSVTDSVIEIQQCKPDILISDIQLQDGTVFDVLEKSGAYIKTLVLITAYDHYAIRAIKYSAIDYLLKPVNTQELKLAMEKCVQQLDTFHLNTVSQINFLQIRNEPKNQNTYGDILINSDNAIHVIRQNEILYCKADRNYTEFYLQDGRVIISSRTLLFYEQLLDPAIFFRVHLSFIINTKHVKTFVKGRSGSVVMTNGYEIDVASRRMALFASFFKSRR